MYIARFILESVTALHCGTSFGFDSNKNDQLDAPVNRDAFGLWTIQGSSIAGILRSYVKEFNDQKVNDLFGNQSSDNSIASKIWCSDARLIVNVNKDEIFASEYVAEGKTLPFEMGPFIRDHVNLNLESDTSNNGGKFDEEIVPIGVKFALEIKLDGWFKESSKEDKEAFFELCRAIKNGNIRFGGKKTNGYGFFKCNYMDIRNFNLNEEESLTSYLNLKDNPKFLPEDGKKIDLDKEFTCKNDLNVKTKDGNFSAKLSIPLVCDGPILVGGYNYKNEDNDTDIANLVTPKLIYMGGEGSSSYKYDYKYTIPGSAIRGAIRHRIYRIAQALNYGNNDNKDITKEDKIQEAKNKEDTNIKNNIISKIFGNEGNTKEQEKDTSDKAKSGKLICKDVYLDIKDSKLVQHVAIDRFTGGALNGALFDERPLWEKGMELNLEIEFKDLSSEFTAYVFHALLDLCTGELPIGGGTNRGNGILKLKNLDKGLLEALKDVKIEAYHNGVKLDKENTKMLNDWCDDLDKALKNEKN